MNLNKFSNSLPYKIGYETTEKTDIPALKLSIT